MTTMIALVGEQPLPNFLPVRHYQPKDLLLIYTTRTQQKYEYLKATLQKKGNINVYGLETNPYDISPVARAIDEELGKLAAVVSQPLMFNLTGGTKAMMLAAYQVAAQHGADVCYLQSEGVQSTVYRYSWHNDQLDLQSREQLPEYLSLRDVLNLHLGLEGKDTWEERGPCNEIGGLFEQAIAQALRDHGYEVMCGVKIYKEADIDVIIRYQNQVGIIEAKIDGQVTKLDGLKQLSTAVRHLGTYTKQFLGVNGKLTDSQDIIREVSRITPILLLHYQRGMSTLTAEDTETLLAAVDKSMRAGMARP